LEAVPASFFTYYAAPLPCVLQTRDNAADRSLLSHTNGRLPSPSQRRARRPGWHWQDWDN